MVFRGFLVVVLALGVSEVQGLKCFQCNSATDEGCMELTMGHTNSTYYKECKATYEDKQPFCRRTKYAILDSNGLTWVSRECGWTLHRDNTTRCYDVDTDYKYEVNCQCFTDGCNGALATLSRPLLLVFLLLAAALATKLVD